MGLDQSFYRKDKPELENEVLYFRKFWALHEYIGDLISERLENGETYRLQPDDLDKIAKFIALNPELYWAYDREDESEDGLDLPDQFYQAVGKLTYYAAKGIPLFYNGDW
jgi:hypothetical protein